MTTRQRPIGASTLIRLLTICAASALSMHAARGDDPLDWTDPGKVPAFRNVVAGEAFDKQFALEAAKVDLAALEADRAAPAGMYVESVEPGSRAESEGLKRGDVIVSVNGVRQWGNELDMSEERKMETVSAEGVARTWTTPEGRLGFQSPKLYWRPELLYFQGKKRNAKWDKLAALGILCRESAPAFAESCWQRAIDAGYAPDYLSAQCGAEIALRQKRYDEAAAFAYYAEKADPAKGELVHPRLLLHVAIATYRWRAAEGVFAREPTVQAITPQQVHRVVVQAERHPRRTPPSERMAGIVRRDITSELVSFLPRDDKQDVAELASGKSITMSREIDHFRFMRIGRTEPIQDAEFLLRFRLKASPGKAQFDKTMIAFLGDIAGDGPKFPWDEETNDVASLRFQFLPNGDQRLHAETSNTIFGYKFRQASFGLDGETIHELQLFCLGDQAEVLLDGRRLVHGPVEAENRNLAFILSVVGTECRIESLRAWELLTDAAAPGEPIRAEGVPPRTSPRDDLLMRLKMLRPGRPR